jgi:hypothetical protein
LILFVTIFYSFFFSHIFSQPKMLSTGAWHGQRIPMVDIIELLEDEPLSLDPGLQYDVRMMILPESIENSPADNQYLWLKWHLYEEAIAFRHELWNAEYMNDLVTFQNRLEAWHKLKDQVLNAIHLGEYRTNRYNYLMNVHVPPIPFPPTTMGPRLIGHDVHFEASLNGTFHLVDGWAIDDPSPSHNG